MAEVILNVVSTTKDKILDIPVSNGQLAFVSDANIITFDMDDTRKIYQMTDTILSSDKDGIEVPGFYYTSDTNILWKYDGTDWIQITRSASEEQGVVYVEGTASNNLIISALGTGIFAVTGQYKLTSTSGTTMTMGKDLFVCTAGHIHQVNGEKVYKYDINPDGTFTASTYLTNVDMADYMTKTEAETVIAQKIDDALNNRIATKEEVDDIFN